MTRDIAQITIYLKNLEVLGGEGKGPILNGLVDISENVKTELVNTLVAFDMGWKSRKKEVKDTGASSESEECEE